MALHKPDALEAVLNALRKPHTTHGKLIVAFGCGGDRDPGKRPIMGEIATRSDRLSRIVTDDNPRSEQRGGDSCRDAWPVRRAPPRSATAPRPSLRVSGC